MLKVVLDTNQFVSSIITKKGPSAQLLQAWRNNAYILITSAKILNELERVLRYPHIAKKYNLNKEDVKALVNLIEHEAVVVYDTVALDIIKDDPDDNKIFACALEAKAQYIVSGDNHLLSLRKYKNIAIVTAKEFLKIISDL